MRLILSWLLAMIFCFDCARLLAEDPAVTERAAIQKTVDAYVASFNKADAKSLSELWVEQGELITAAGERWQGRQQLQEQFAQYFSTAKEAKLELEGTQIELQSPHVAVETGLARVLVSGQEPSETKYRAVHLKGTDGWRIDSIREDEVPTPPPSHYEQLQELEWMVGRWADVDRTGKVETSCRWTSNRNFLVQTFKVVVDGAADFEGTQVIGWDPHAGTIRSWTFDSDGGFGAGRWSRGEGRWTVNTVHVLPDGRRGSATNIYELVNDNTVRYRSIGRQVDGELLPSVGPVNVVRQPD